MKYDLILLVLISSIGAIPQISYNETAIQRGSNGLLGNFTSNPEETKVSSDQSQTQSLVQEMNSTPLPNNPNPTMIPSQTTTDLQLQMQKAFQDFAMAIAQIANQAQLQAAQLTANPQTFAQPIANPNAQPASQPATQPVAQPEPQAQPPADPQPSNDANAQQNQESSTPPAPESTSNSEQSSDTSTEQGDAAPSGDTRSMLSQLFASNNEASSVDNYPLQFQSSPLPEYHPVYFKVNLPTMFDYSSIGGMSSYSPSGYPLASYSGYADSVGYHSLAHSKPSAKSAKPISKHSIEASSSSSSSPSPSKPRHPSISLKSLTNHKEIKASSVHPQSSENIPQSTSEEGSSTSSDQLDKVLTQIENETAPMLKRRERYNNLESQRVVIEDKFSRGEMSASNEC